jgi:hypothetical protein
MMIFTALLGTAVALSAGGAPQGHKGSTFSQPPAIRMLTSREQVVADLERRPYWYLLKRRYPELASQMLEQSYAILRRGGSPEEIHRALVGVYDHARRVVLYNASDEIIARHVALLIDVLKARRKVSDASCVVTATGGYDDPRIGAQQDEILTDALKAPQNTPPPLDRDQAIAVTRRVLQTLPAEERDQVLHDAPMSFGTACLGLIDLWTGVMALEGRDRRIAMRWLISPNP